jgi:ABC-type transport system involved in Fe-S cluster assembly fused permease/ATPase subunit
MSDSHVRQGVFTRADWKTIRTLFPYLWEYRGRVGLALALLIVAKLAHVAVPLVFKAIVDALDKPHAMLALPTLLLAGYGGLRLASSLCEEWRDAVFARVTLHPIRQVTLQVFRHLHALALRFHVQRQTGGVSRDIERGTRAMSFLLSLLLFNILPTLVEIGLVAGILLTKYDIWFVAITFVTLISYILFTLVITEWRMVFRRAMNDLDSQANAWAIDSLLNYETVKYFGNEHYEAQRYDAYLQRWEQAAGQYQTSLAALSGGQSLIIAIGLTLLLLLAGQGVVQGTMSVGDLVVINALMLQIYPSLHFLGFVYRESKHALADIENMFRLLEHSPELQDRPGATDLVLCEGTIRFEHVEFAYEPNRQILFDVDFEIPVGATVAVVGASGAGKSTLARLLLRLYDVTAGRVLLDGQDLRDVTQHSLRSAIGTVPQDVVLFNETLAYNIAYGRPGAGREEIMRAAKGAGLHRFIESLPCGYDTIVGERGLKLSGGEKQRVAIARVLLKNPRLLIFDEATSALDSTSERAIHAELRRLAKGRTTVVIAHRLSTIVEADQIVVLDHGRIVERGTHQELLVLGGRYAQMWAVQQREDAREKAEEASVLSVATARQGIPRDGGAATLVPRPAVPSPAPPQHPLATTPLGV